MGDDQLIDIWNRLGKTRKLHQETVLWVNDPYWGPQSALAKRAGADALVTSFQQLALVRWWLNAFRSELSHRRIKIPPLPEPEPPPLLSLKPNEYIENITMM